MDKLHGPAEAWLADYRSRIDEIRVRAERAHEELAGLSATASSKDGAVTATVRRDGALSGLAFGPAAEGLSRARLAELVLATAAEAGAEVAARVAAVVAPRTAGSR
jgi:hypothetical protein